jgi:hypothetical protein
MKKRLAAFCASMLLAGICFGAEQADLILRNGKVVTVDDRFTITPGDRGQRRDFSVTSVRLKTANHQEDRICMRS